MTPRAVAAGDTLQLRYALRPRGGDDLVSNFDDPEPETVTLGDGTLALTYAKVILVHTHWSAP